MSSEFKILSKNEDRWETMNIIHTPDGDLTWITVQPSNNPGTITIKPIKDFKEDFKKLKHLYSEVISYDDSTYRQQKKEITEALYCRRKINAAETLLLRTFLKW